MKIAYIVPALVNKGPVIVVKELVAEFVKNGHTCKVFYFDEKVELNFECPVSRIHKGQINDFSEFNIIHSHGLRPDKYVHNNFSKRSNSQFFVTTLHNYVLLDLRHQYNWIISFLFGNLWMYWIKKHDKIVTLSKDAQQYYGRWFSKEKLTFAYNTRKLDTTKKLCQNELNEILNFKGKSSLIGVNALLTNIKGIDILIKALPFLPKHKLFIVGDGKSRKRLEKLASRLNVDNRCFFAGYKPDAYRYLEHYDVFALPSRSEGFPLSLLEASIYSIPVVTSDIPIIKEAFTSEEVSFFELSNPMSIVEAIKAATFSKILGVSLNKKYLNSYSPKIMYERYLGIYSQIIK